MAKVKIRVEKECVICGNEFSVIPSRAKSAKTCGLECRGKLIGKSYKDKRVKFECSVCGTKFESPPCHASRRKYCSVKCADVHRNDNMPKGEDNWNWKGGKTKHSCGYKYIRASNHPYSSNGYVFEHRLIMEDLLRKDGLCHPFLIAHGELSYLSPDVVVHHMDEVKDNNDPSNLLACTASAHSAIHGGGGVVDGDTWPECKEIKAGLPYYAKTTCPICSNGFKMKRSDVARGRKYCSRKCYNDSRSIKFSGDH